MMTTRPQPVARRLLIQRTNDTRNVELRIDFCFR